MFPIEYQKPYVACVLATTWIHFAQKQKMVKHIIVGFVGPKGSGKDAAANALIRHCGFQGRAFASFLKETCRNVFMLSYEQLYGDKKEEVDERWNTTPRRLMQVVGTELFRDALQEALPELNVGDGETLWCRCFRLWLEQFRTPMRVAVTDVRYEDEMKLIKELGGIVIRIDRPGIANDDMHISEQEQRKMETDYTVVNDGTLLDLANKVVDITRDMLPKPKITLNPKRKLTQEPSEGDTGLPQGAISLLTSGFEPKKRRQLDE